MSSDASGAYATGRKSHNDVGGLETLCMLQFNDEKEDYTIVMMVVMVMSMVMLMVMMVMMRAHTG